MANEFLSFTPIGVFKTSQVHPYEAGRQPDSHHSEGIIELTPGNNFEQALTGLEGCTRIWILFVFHHNSHWNPMVMPPRGSDKKIGVFATRSPYRPNPIGMSTVEVLDINKLRIKVSGADLLDNTPILDIKPYLSYADSFENTEPDWLKNSFENQFSVSFNSESENSLLWLEAEGLKQFRPFLIHQLEFDPTNDRKKRVKALTENKFIIAYRTWRAEFTLEDSNILITRILSGYTELDLKNALDKYADKDLHRRFNNK